MGSFEDIGRTVLEITIADRLGDTARLHDIPTLVDAYIVRFGYKDLGEVPAEEFEELARRYLLN